MCIDQNNISDGLKVLPINVMACKKMLVLWSVGKRSDLVSFLARAVVPDPAAPLPTPPAVRPT